jgi:hypothetical protein
MIIKTKLLFIILFPLILASCEKYKPLGPYDLSTHLQQFSAKINGVDFDLEDITIFTPDDPKHPIGVFAQGSDYLINIYIGINCGKKTFTLPDSNQDAALMMENISCKSGRLTITKYDVNLVEGTFEFDVEINNSILQITDGSFSIVYRLN